MPVEKIAKFANLIASKVCTAVGSTEGQPTKSELNNFLKEGDNVKKEFFEKLKNKS